jgi:segregation and condensation protein A
VIEAETATDESEGDWLPMASVPEGDGALYLELDGWEGPLDLLLDLARRQKVDLRRISILDLVDQYLLYINSAQSLRLELAADYLVMAAWLAYLKSLLLLPRDPEVQPGPEELALRLQLRLQRLGAMRDVASRLMARDRLGRDVFAHGQPEGVSIHRKSRWTASLYDLIQAYGGIKARNAPVVHMVRERPVVTLEAALERLMRMLGVARDWIDLRALLPRAEPGADPRLTRSALASSFAAALELAKQGRAELAQDEVFGPIRLRSAGAL